MGQVVARVKTRVCLAGVTGWVGRRLLPAILGAPDLELTGAVSRSRAGSAVGELVDTALTTVERDLDLTIRACVDDALAAGADVLVDYTSPSVVKSNVMTAIKRKVHVVIGTSGLTAADFDEIDRVARRHGVGVFAGANFAISAVLLERFAAIAARFLPSWEVIDYAKPDKPDAPSGTARQLAHRLSLERAPSVAIPIEQTHGAPAARGFTLEGTQIHSVRLPGHVIGLEVVFGSADERLSIRYDGGHGADPYVTGTLFAARRVAGHVGVRRDLEGILEDASAG